MVTLKINILTILSHQHVIDFLTIVVSKITDMI